MYKMIKRMPILLLLVLILLLLAACTPEETAPANDDPVQNDVDRSLAGRYVGYSWRGEAGGTSFEEADQYIETILELDESGVITNATIRFFVLMDGFWIPRSSGNAYVAVDYDAQPVAGTPGEDYEPGTSMFTVYTADMMAFYAAGVNEEGVVAAVLVDPITRFQFEYRFTPDFDFSRPAGDLTIGSGLAVPTVRTSAAAYIRPEEWDELADATIFNVDMWSHVVNDVGVLTGIGDDSTVQEFLEALGVEFSDGIPQSSELTYGYFGLGGWHGNYEALREALIGQNATELTSLVDWSIQRYAGAVNKDNIFGVDVESGATRTVQNSIDGISGATVRISREATSYQRALVEAGIISEEDVIIGRF